jgi:hypothetical protein
VAAGKSGKCPVIVAKLDRLSRDVAFIVGIRIHWPKLAERRSKIGRTGDD